MLALKNIDDYIQQQDLNKINVGASGTNVFITNDGLLLKFAKRNEIHEIDVWNSYVREAVFYETVNKVDLPCIPELYHIQHSEDEVILIMKKERMIERHEITKELLKQIINTLVSVHLFHIPAFLHGEESESELLDETQIEYCIKGWKSVLSEHPSMNVSSIDLIAANINLLRKRCTMKVKKLIHGDFHCDNLLIDSNGDIIICDWQKVSYGDPSSDLSFFISRLLSDGYSVNEDELISMYCEAYKEQSGEIIDSVAIKRAMCLQNLNTTFLFWHEYLHGSNEERVRKIYYKMIASMNLLLFL